VQTGIHSNFLLVSLEVRSQSAGHHSVVLLELPPLGDLAETLALQRKIKHSFLGPNLMALFGLIKKHLTLKETNTNFHFDN